MTAPPAVEGWFTDQGLIADRCTACGTMFFPPVARTFCGNPACDGEAFEPTQLSARGRVWSYTDFQYQPPAPYIPRTDPYQPFALAAVELPEGIVVLGQVADGYGVDDLRVGAEVEFCVESLDQEHTIWRWKPVGAQAQEVTA